MTIDNIEARLNELRDQCNETDPIKRREQLMTYEERIAMKRMFRSLDKLELVERQVRAAFGIKTVDIPLF